jgi:hypothetical protein
LLHGLYTSLTRGTRGLVVVCLKSGTGGNLSAGLSRSVGCRPVFVSSTSLLSVVGDRGDFSVHAVLFSYLVEIAVATLFVVQNNCLWGVLVLVFR